MKIYLCENGALFVDHQYSQGLGEIRPSNIAIAKLRRLIN